MTERRTFGPFNLLQAHAEEPPPAEFHARHEIGEQLRQLTDRLVRTKVDGQQLATVKQSLADLLAQFPVPDRQDSRAATKHLFSGQATVEDVYQVMDYDVVAGAANPLMPPLHWSQQSPDGVAADVCYSDAYEGPPGRVHGGILALLLDGVLARAVHAGHRIGMTGTLSIRYLAASPLHENLQARAHIVRQEGRKTFVEGGVWCGDQQTVAAEGVWLMPKGV